MSNFTLTKEAPTKNDKKSTAQGTMLRQQGFHEANKRRVFLQDNSWIKKRPEEEKDENYGRVVLNRHNSHDALDRKTIEGDESKATISRYRSDDTLDRISDRKDAGKACKANTLDNQLTSRYQSLSTFRSLEPTKSQPGDLFRANITTSSSSNNMASSPAPIKKKRQSWFPPPPPGHKVTESLGANKREPGAHPPIPPKPSSPISSPNLLRRDNRQVCPPKPGVPTETSSPEKNTRQICPPKPRASTETRSPEKNTRSSQDCDNIVKVDTSSQKTNKGEELDNLIIKNKSLNRKQGLDGLFRANPKTELSEKRAKSLENLIYVNSRMDKDGKGNQSFGSLTRVNQRTDKNEKGKQDLDGLIKVTPETTVNIKRGHSLENVIKATLDVNRRNQGSEDLGSLIKMNPRTGKTVQGDKSLDNLIKVTPEANRSNQGTQGLDNLIKVNPSAKKSSKQGLDELIHVNPNIVKNITGCCVGERVTSTPVRDIASRKPSQKGHYESATTRRSQNLDKLIKVNPETLTNNQRNQDLANLIAVNPAVIKNNQSNQVLDKVKPPALRNTKQDLDLENVMEVNANVPENKNGRPNEQVSGSTKALHKQSSGPTSYSYESRNSLSSSVGTSHTGPKDTVVYTRTYVENSKSPRDVYAENISGKCIQTVYSTSDRSVIERDMCTYCRKPLGTETKMILDELHICCHSTCFKCEICKQPLENLKAGDSIWIYRQTIHCEPCYSKVMAKWIQ